MTKSILRIAATTTVIAGVALAGSSNVAAANSTTDSGSAATAACRPHAHQPLDEQLGSVLNADTPFRITGPYSECQIIDRIDPGYKSLLYHCYVVNDVGNTWTWVTVRATGQQGWIYDGNLQFGGSTLECL